MAIDADAKDNRLSHRLPASGYRLRADANGDDCVDDADLGIVLEFYGCEAPWTGSCAGWQAADLNEDGLVDDADLAWVSEDYGAFAWLYEYDVYGNLIYAGSPCVGEYEAAYDAFGRRVWERIDPTGQSPIETHFVYDGDALALELSPNGTPLVQYVQGLLGPIARVDLQNGSNTRYYVLDARGHARALVDSSGAVTDYYEYDAWGNVLPGSYGSAPNPFRWNAAAGYQHVPFTGLYHVGAREYDPRTARWLQRDPIGQSSGDPNLYRYCGNDAVNLSDPDGARPLTETDIRILRKLYQHRGKIALSSVNFIVSGIKKKILNVPEGVPDPVPLRAVMWAIDQLGDPSYGESGVVSRGPLRPVGQSENKCNLFVAHSYGLGGDIGFGTGGFPVRTRNPFAKPYPLSANSFGNEAVSCIYPFQRLDGCSSDMLGAVVSFANPAGGDNPGHMGILLADSVLIYAGSEGVKLGTWGMNQRGKLPAVIRVFKP